MVLAAAVLIVVYVDLIITNKGTRLCSSLAENILEVESWLYFRRGRLSF